MPGRIEITSAQQDALFKSIETLCALFRGPGLDQCKEMLKGNFFVPFEKLDSLLNCNPPAALENLKRGTLEFSDEQSLLDYLETSYVRLFINARTGITAPLYHSCYLDTDSSDSRPGLMGESAGFMKQRLRSRGLSIDGSIKDPPDHLCIELEYLYFLLQQGMFEEDEGAMKEAISFAGAFMLPWVTVFRDRLLGNSACYFYPIAAAILTTHLQIVTRMTKKTRPVLPDNR